jgi:hypothetical protein
MRVRVAVLIVLAVVLAAAAMLAIWQSAGAVIEAQHLFGYGTTTSPPSQAAQDRANALWTQSGALQEVATPLASCALLCATAVLAMLAWDWQRRVGRPER